MQETYASEVNIPTFTEHPESMKVLYGDTVKFKVTASGTNLKYQWQYKPNVRNGTWTNTGSNSNELSVLVTYHDEYLYRCLISDDVYSGDSAIQSNAACLHVITDQVFKVQHISEVPTAPVITTQPQPVQTVMGSTATFTVEATGDNLVYQWQYKPSVLNGTWTNATEASAKTNTYTTSALTFANSGYEYRCIVRDNDGYYYGDQNAVTSDSAMVRVIPEGYTKVIYINESYNITAHPASRLVLPGESVTFSVVAEGNTELTYRWLYKSTEENSTWTEVPSSMGTGAQTDTLVINKVLDEYDNYMFRCSVGGSIYVYEKSLLSNVAYLMTIEPQQIVTAQYKPSFSVNGTYYPFLQSAYDAIEGTDGTIVVYEDAEDDSTIVIEDGKNITIDTNGKTLTLTTTGITNNGTLTIDGTGTIKTTNNAIDSVVYNNGTLNVVNGTIEGPKNVVYNTSTGNLTVGASGGSVSTSSPALIGGTYGVNSETGFYFYDGVMKGTTAAYNGEILEIEDEYTLLETSETVSGTTKQIATLQMEITPSVMITEWTIPAGGATIKLPVAGTGLNVMIDWGDGTISGDVTTEFPTHTYTEGKEYTIMIRGTVPSWGYYGTSEPKITGDNSKYYTYTQYLTSVEQWGDISAERYGFAYCKKLSNVSDVTTENTFANVEKMAYMFRDCIRLTTLNTSTWNANKLKDIGEMFSGCTDLTDLNISELNTSMVWSMGGVFKGCTSLVNLDLSGWETAGVTNMSSMFEGCSALKTLSIVDWNTAKVSNMYRMFYNCSQLEELDVSSWNTWKVNNMDSTFCNCAKLQELDVSDWNVESATTMSGMFAGCSNLKMLEVSDWNTAKVTLMLNMFKGCKNLSALDVGEWTTDLVTDMSSMFEGCSSIDTLDMHNWNTSQVQNLHKMFYDCTALNVMFVSNKFAVTTVTSTEMFVNAENLSRVIILSDAPSGDQFGKINSQIPNAKYYVPNESLEAYRAVFSDKVAEDKILPMIQPIGESEMQVELDTKYTEQGYTVIGYTKTFADKYKKYGYNVTVSGEVNTAIEGTYNIEYILTRTYESGDETVVSNPMKAVRTVEVIDIMTYMITEWTIPAGGATITLPVTGTGLNITIDWGDGTVSGDVTTEFPTHKYAESGEYDIAIRGTVPKWGYNGSNAPVESDENTGKYYTYSQYLTGLKQWGELSATRYGFSFCTNLKYVSGDATNNTFDNITNMSYMFYSCTNLTSVDFSNFKTDNVTSMYSMFMASGVKNLNLSSFNTDKVQNFSNMFYGCGNLKRVDLNIFSTAVNTNMQAMFWACKNLTELDVSNWNTSNVTNMQSMFNGCGSLSKLDVSAWKTSNVTNMYYMFQGCRSLTQLDVSGWNTSKVSGINMEGMFSECNSLKKLDLSNWNTSNVTNMQRMFKWCNSLIEIDISGLDTENVTTMGEMFFGCSSLKELDFSTLNTSNVKSMTGIFSGCTNLTNLNLSNLNTSNVTNMKDMFAICSSLTNLDVSNFDTKNVTNFAYMFNSCKSLKSILISEKIIISGDTTGMFRVCNNLSAIITISKEPVANQFNGVFPANATLYVPNDSLSAYTDALSGDSSVNVIAPIIQPVGKSEIVLNIGDAYTDAGYTVAGFTPDESDYYTVYGYGVTTSGDVNTYAEGTYEVTYDLTRTVTNASGDTTTTDVGEAKRTVEVVDKTSYMITEWTIPAGGAEIKLPVKGNGLDITIDWGDGTITKVSGDLTVENFPTHTYTNTEEKKFDISIRGNCPEFGYYSENAVTVDENTQYLTFVNHLTGLKQWGRLNATRYGFAGCTNLTYVSGDAVSNTFSNLTSMAHMFNNCTSLERIDLSKFKTASVTDMSNMFNGCSELTSLNVSSFDTINVTNMSFMFNGCKKVTSLNLSNFNTSKVTNMRGMFTGCNLITTLNLSNFNTENVTDMRAMFNKCSGLTTLYIDKFNTKNVSNMYEMFRDCSNLTTLNVSNFNTENVTRMDNMFYRCSKLTELDVSNFNTSKVENMNGMFLGCSKLDELDVSSFNTSNVTKMVSMFSACNDLTSLDLSNFDTTKVIDMSYMLSGLEILETVDISGFTTSGDTNMELMFQDNPNLKSIQISNKFVIPETATNMFNGCTNLSAIITVSDTPNENQFNNFATVVPSTAKLYVPNGSEHAYIEAISGDVSEDKIAPLLQMSGDSYILLNIDDEYVENYYTVAGFTKDEASAYEVYGYNVNMSGDVDTSNLGFYNIEYELTRTYTIGDTTITTAPMTEIREVEITDRSKYMITEWNVVASQLTIQLPVSGDVDIMVDWGDGSELEHIEGTFGPDNFPTHTYAAKGVYEISINGTLDEWGYSSFDEIDENSPYYTYCGGLTGLKQWGELGAKRYGFAYCANLTYVSGDATKNTFKNVTSMATMFYTCVNLTSIDLSEFDTLSVKNMDGMFARCENIISLDLTSFDTSNVEFFIAMFEGCTKLQTIIFPPDIDTSNAKDMRYMFNKCRALVDLDISKFDTSGVTSMEAMFNWCRKLKVLDLSNFDTSSVTTMEAMFYWCTSLEELNVSSFDTSNVENMKLMFSYCASLKSIDVSKFNTSKVTNMQGMFQYCRLFTQLDVSNFDTSNVTNMATMFQYCSSFTQLDVSNFDTSNVTNMSWMFAYCDALTKLNLDNFNTSKVTNMFGMFYDCKNLKVLNLYGFDTSSLTNSRVIFYNNTSLESILVTNKFVSHASDAINMFTNTPALNKIIITSEETNGSQFATVKDQMDGKTFYVPNASVDAYREAFSGDYSGDKVQPILQLLGKEKVNILMGNPYEEMNYTVAGFGIDEIERYLVYGYNVEISGEVDIWQAGEYKLDYILTRTYQNVSGETVEEKNIATRIVTVYDKPILTLYENGELYDGEWTSNNIVGVMELLAPESTWISVKAGNSEWTVNPQYAEIVKSGDEMTITFTESMGEYVYVREIDTKGHATTYETSGDMIKIDREAPIIKNFHGETKDKLLNIVAAVSDDVSGIKEYVVTETTVFPREWQAYDSGDISYPVPNSGIYYLWLKDNANNISSGEIYATRDVIPPRGIIEIEPVNILSGDGFNNIIVVNKDKISGEKYTNKDTVNIDIHITDNETDPEELMFALYNEDEYTAVKRGEKRIEWRQYVPRVEWPLPQDEGDYVVYAIFKDNAGNESMTLGEFADQALTTYVVHHYLENPNDTGYSAYEISTEIGRAGVAVDVNSIVKEIPGAIYEKASLRLDGVATTSIVVEGDGTTEVYLHYKRTRHELVLNSNEAIASVKTAGMYKWGQTVILEATLGNDIAYNYGFTNWVVNSGDVTIVEPEKLRTQFRMPSGDVEITAIGTKDIKTFTINFNANGGEVTPATKTLEYYENYGELPTPTRNGYDFIGWYTSPTGGEEIDTTIAPNSNRTIYAHWHSLLLADYVDVGQYVNLGINYSNVPTASTTTQTPTLTGWRVLSVDNGNDGEKYVRLVSAGIPLTYVHKYGSTGDGKLSENNLTTGFFDIPLNKTTATDYQFHRSGLGSSVTNSSTLKQLFLNNKYIDVDETGTPKVQSMTLSDVQSIYNIHKTGTVGNSTEVNDAIFDEMLALKSSDSTYYARYHLATEAFENYLWCSYNSGAVVYSGGEMGVRPVVTLRADVIQKGQNANGVWQIGFDE